MRTDIVALNLKSVFSKYWSPKKQDLKSGSSHKTIYLAALMWLLMSCVVRYSEEDAIIHAADLLESLSQDMDSLTSLNDSIWNQVSQAMKSAIPADLPVAEKRNLLAVKNADLIQMFEVFDSFEDPLKNLVMEAGKSDQEIAMKMRNIMNRVDEQNKILTQSFATLEKKDRRAAERLRQKIASKINMLGPDQRI